MAERAKGKQRDEWNRFSLLVSHVANGPSKRIDERAWSPSDFNPFRDESQTKVTVVQGDFIDMLAGRK